MTAYKDKSGQMTFDFDDMFNAKDTSPEPDESWENGDEEVPVPSDPEAEAEQAEEIMESMSNLPDVPAKVSTPSKPKNLFAKNLKRAAVAFLAELGADAIATDVPTRGTRYCVDAAAFWLTNNKGSRSVCRTALAEIRTAQEIKIECANHADKLFMLRAARLECEEIKTQIRKNEPELRDGSTLFSEFEQWNYAASKNPAYKECMQRIHKLEYTIYHTSKLSRFNSAQIASELYLIVPADAVQQEDIPENWGLVYVREDLSFELVKKPVKLDCPKENLSRLAWNIATSAKDQVLFANGIHTDSEQHFYAGAMPRKRRSSF